MTNKAIAFLDLLGFSNNLNKNAQSALEVLINTHTVLDTKIMDPQKEEYKNSKLSVSSFENFLPFSDSIFISTNDPKLFIEQISELCLSCFMFTSHAYMNPENSTDPTSVTIKGVCCENGKVKVTSSKEFWFPVLFRGGISFGKVYELALHSIQYGRTVPTFNLVGEAVVNAVALEKKGKGPRIFCDQEFADQLTSKEAYLFETKQNGIYEVLWPIALYNDDNSPKDEINKFYEIFIPAVNLWKAFNHYDYGIQYYNFIKLIIISTVKYFEKRDYTKEAKEQILHYIRQEALEIKEKDLLKIEAIG